MHFRGVSAVNLDAKGRMALPVRFREALHDVCAGRVVITIDMDERCLLLYPLPAWEQIQAQVDALPNVNREARRIQRLLIGHATDAELDGSGRVLVPPMLREFASLSKKLILIGQGKKLEIWAEESWLERRDAWLGDGVGRGLRGARVHFSVRGKVADAAHITVMLDEAVEGLAVRPDARIVDATFGRGGHARAVLERLGPAAC